MINISNLKMIPNSYGIQNPTYINTVAQPSQYPLPQTNYTAVQFEVNNATNENPTDKIYSNYNATTPINGNGYLTTNNPQIYYNNIMPVNVQNQNNNINYSTNQVITNSGMVNQIPINNQNNRKRVNQRILYFPKNSYDKNNYSVPTLNIMAQAQFPTDHYIPKDKQKPILKKHNSSNFKVNKKINNNNSYTPRNNNRNSNKGLKIDNLALNEAILLKNQEQSANKDLDIKSHFDIEVTKERYLFDYKKVLKVAMPLLSHYEMPSEYDYRSPLLSQEGQYLSCIAKSKIKDQEDIAFIWDTEDLYWYKHKFSIAKSKIDSIVFSPDSRAVLVIYIQANPVLYNLENGEKILEFEGVGEENKKSGIHYAFSTKGNYLGYTTDKSFVLWNMKSGKIFKKIKDDAPIKLLFNEFIISFQNDLNCEIKFFQNIKLHHKFRIKGIQNINEILDVKCASDMTYVVYIIKQGVIKYTFSTNKFQGVQKFQPGVEKACISDDCRFVVKTNMRNLTIYDIEKGDTIGTILKEKFNDYIIDFNNEKLIVIDNISINIHDYTDGGIPEQFIWLNKNPNKFLDVKFSHDFKFLFALIDQNNVIAYDLNTGVIIKKWQNVEKNWKNFTVSEFSGNNIACNSDLFLVKIWNYITGREEATFYGFDSYSFHFSSNGNYLACGAKNGPEAARIWDIEKGTFGSFPYVGNNSNFHTIVHLTSPEPTRLICCSIDQQPLIFDTNSKELLYKCECLYRFEEIYEIKSDQTYDVFIVKGRDVKKRDIGLLYRLSDGILLETYENYTILELARDNGVVISKCDNINGGRLTSTDVKNLGDPLLNDFQIQTDKIQLLNDNKSIVVVTHEEEYKKEYCLLNAEDGGYFGRINFFKKNERNSENYITVDPVEKFIYFRYFEFLSPQESRSLRNKFFFGKNE